MSHFLVHLIAIVGMQTLRILLPSLLNYKPFYKDPPKSNLIIVSHIFI